MRPLLRREEIQRRLRMVFPRPGFDTVSSNPSAAAAVATMLFIDAVVPAEGDLPATVHWLRPSMVLWMSDELYAVDDEATRGQWYEGARRGRKQAERVERDAKLEVSRWYADNSREGVRDETFSLWMANGAMRKRPGVATTSSAGRWAMTGSFADLFDPELDGDELVEAIDAWREAHMDPGVLARVLTLRAREEAEHQVVVQLPANAGTRTLGAGESSRILKGVVERWAPARLADPVVLTISEPGAKLLVADERSLRSLGLTLDPGNLLPDALLVDIGAAPAEFWIVEAVASAGPIDERRRERLLAWAAEHRIPPQRCRFLTAFLDRDSGPAKRHLKDLAAGTFAWFESEPGHELSWHELPGVDGA